MSTTGTSTGKPLLSLAQVAKLLSDPTRWRLLREMSKGEMLPIAELAQHSGCSSDSAYRHLVLLIRMGIAVLRYRGFYAMAPAYVPPAGSTTIDLGHCVVRLDTPLT